VKDSHLFDRIGAAALRAVLVDFYDRVFADVMIGFMFQQADKQRLIDKEYELVAALLGAPNASYTGKPMREAHAKHSIFGGQFERRLQILRNTLRDHAVDAEVVEAWIDHAQSLRAQITCDRGSECEDAPPPEPSPDKPVKLGRRG
jgi:hemoglobin